MQNVTNIFADAYGCGTYGSSSYESSATTCATSGSATGSSSGAAAGGVTGALTNTGFDLLLIATLAVVIIFIAFVVRFWKRPKRSSLPPSPNPASNSAPIASTQKDMAVGRVDPPQQGKTDDQ